MSSVQRSLEPGDLIVATHDMRAWETDERRGVSGEWVLKGEQALVINTWHAGNQIRIRVLRDLRVLLFSCPTHVVYRNWRIANTGIE
jgi:hypothetical protein